MMKKTWFLPPDFTFLPDGEVRLGMILKYPDRPTLALDSLESLTPSDPAQTPTIHLPDVSSLTETYHEHSMSSGHSASHSLFAKFVELASASRKADTAQYKDLSLGTVDHEIRTYKRALSPATLQALVQLEPVKKYINGGLFGRHKKRRVYVISGLRIAKKSFSVKKTADSKSSTEANLSASGKMSGVPLPVEGRGNVTDAEEGHAADGYNTGPGIVFGYRLHVIQDNSDGAVETELFSDTTAFLTGGGDEEDEDEHNMVLAEVTGEMLKGAQEVKSDVEEHVIGDETVIVFTSK